MSLKHAPFSTPFLRRLAQVALAHAIPDKGYILKALCSDFRLDAAGSPISKIG